MSRRFALAFSEVMTAQRIGVDAIEDLIAGRFQFVPPQPGLQAFIEEARARGDAVYVVTSETAGAPELEAAMLRWLEYYQLIGPNRIRSENVHFTTTPFRQINLAKLLRVTTVVDNNGAVIREARNAGMEAIHFGATGDTTGFAALQISLQQSRYDEEACCDE